MRNEKEKLVLIKRRLIYIFSNEKQGVLRFYFEKEKRRASLDNSSLVALLKYNVSSYEATLYILVVRNQDIFTKMEKVRKYPHLIQKTSDPRMDILKGDFLISIS